MDGMTRGEVAEKAGVNPETLRYYERKELIPKPPRSDGGFRLYDDSYVDRLRFIRRAKDLGFTLAEIKDLLELRVDDEATCRDVKVQADEKIDEVEEKIRVLQRIHEALTQLAAACEDSQGPTSECPILDAMEDESALTPNMSNSSS
jgi:MerR family mercuric resistance operon transcriptional regulator